MAARLVGGLGNYLLRVGLALKERGHQPTVFLISTHSAVEDYRGIRYIQVAGKNHHALRRLARGTRHANAYHSRLLADAIARLHREEPIDIVQYTNYRATALYRRPEMPAVMRISSYRPLWDPFHPTAEASRSRRIAARLEDASLRTVDAVYSPSRVLAEAITADTGIRVDVIEPPFVMDEVELDRSIVESTVGTSPFLLFAGHLTRRKGVDAIATGIEAILERHPDHLFVFVGRSDTYGGGVPGIEDTHDLVRRRAGAHADRLRFVQPIPHRQLYAFYERAAAVVLPSVIDNIANTALEAMALGAVVVGTDGGSFEQLIVEGASGFLCKPDDGPSLVAAVDRALAIDAAQRRTIGEAARRRIGELAPDITVPKLLDYYRGVIDRFGRGA